MQKPKLSVIIPCYNSEKFLRECLDSLVNQSLKDIEIICVNDASSDKTSEILEEYSKKDGRIKLISHEKNQGLSAARNTGILNSTGEFISFVDSDDYVDGGMMEKLYNKAVTTGAEIVIGNIYLYFEDTGKLEIFRNKRFFTFLSGRVFTLTEYPALVSCIAAWDRIYKSELIKDNSVFFPIGLVYEDQIFSIKTMALAKGITVLNEPLYYYRKNRGGSITDDEKKNDRYKFDFLEITALSKSFMKEAGIYEILREEYMSYQFFAAAVHQHNIKDKKTFKRFFDKMRELSSENDLKSLHGANLPYIAERYLSALESGKYSDFYKLTKTLSLGKSFLKFFIPKEKRK